MKRTLTRLMLAAMCLSWAPLSARAAEAETETETRAEEEERARAEESRKAKTLSERYGVSEEEILGMRGKGMGWGEVGHALAIAGKAERPLAEVLALRESGLGWGRIARKYGFSLGEAVRHSPGEGRERPDRDALKERGKERQHESRRGERGRRAR